MKTQEGFKNNNNGQGQPKSDRAFTDQNGRLKERGISNSGGQRSDVTSNKNSAHKPEHKKA
jgi:hypothetical protein